MVMNITQTNTALGNSQSEIARTLHISQPTISRDIVYIKSKYITNSKIQSNEFQKNTSIIH